MAMVPLELSEVLLIDKPNTKSTIYKCFGFVPDNNGKPINTESDKPKCKICRTTVSTKTSNATKLHFHLCQRYPQ